MRLLHRQGLSSSSQILQTDMKTDWLDDAERSGLNFYACRLPGCDVEFGASSVLAPGLLPGGFAVASWLGSPVSILPADEEMTPCCTDIFAHLPDSTARKTHENAVRNVVKALGGDPCAKAVISRVERAPRPSSLGRLFDALCCLYPDSAVFCFRIVNGGTWIGASPELLLRRRGVEVQTVALAGTRPAGSKGSWDDKNIREQQMVTDYICRWMKAEGIVATLSERQTRKAGPVEHLATEIRGCLPKEWNPERGLRTLAPTPALGGYPKELALNLISQSEEHNRGCYGGWFGPVRENSDFDFYVNLRSMLVGENEVALYVGGGITSQSEPTVEWEETCLKAETLKAAMAEC